MTGYGVARVWVPAEGARDARDASEPGTRAPDAPAEGTELTVELRAVNHRFLDIRVRMPSGLSALTASVEEVLKEQCLRGRVEAYVRYDPEAAPPSMDHERVERALRELATVRDRVCPGEPLPIALLGGLPGVFRAPPPPNADALKPLLTQATLAAASALRASRQQEGKALAADLHHMLSEIDTLMDIVERARPALVEAYEARLRDRMQKALAEEALALDPGRLVTEVAVFADKTDVAEEISRLRGHLAHFRDIMESAGSVGRKLDFLTQELFREANTLGTKTPDIEITHVIVDLKSTLERVREQVQNVL